MSFKYKQIMITGGAGFVGSNLAIRLKSDHPEVTIIVLDNLKRRGSELILERLKKYGIDFQHADVRNKADLEGVSGDLIIECSAEPSAQAGINGGLDYLVDTNLGGALNCLNLAAALKADFLFLSTSRVYPFDRIGELSFKETATRFEFNTSAVKSGVSAKGISEDFPLAGVRTFYGATKLAAEYLIKEYIHFKKIKAIINRCGLITGPWQMGKVDQGVVVFWLAAHILGKPLKYIGWGGKQVRDFINISDLYELVKLQLDDFDAHSGSIFNVGGGRDFSFSLLELTKACQKVTGRKIKITDDPATRDGDICWYIGDSSKARACFDWAPRKNITQTLEEINEWAQAHKKFIEAIV